MTKITKAVIPCGGRGTRFLPITKTMPKEMLPIIDTPVLSYIVEEAVKSGITDVLLIINSKKTDILKYFTPDSELEDELLSKGKTEYFDRLKKIYSSANITFAYQNQPKGSADAVYQAKSFTGNQPFCLSWGDDLICSKKPVMGQLISAFDSSVDAIIGVQEILSGDIVKYGVVDVDKKLGKNKYSVKGIVEKPTLESAPSTLASLGRYVLTKKVYDAIEKTPVGVGGEYQLTDSLQLMSKKSKLMAYVFEGKRYDMGDKLGSVKAVTEFALSNPEFGDKYRSYIKELAKTL